MRVLSKDDVLKNKSKLFKELSSGAVFIYPTDTIYGIGCDATNESAVNRIRELKQRDSKPFSVIVPSKDWIRENCVILDKAAEWLKKLPGAYTFILPLRKQAVSKSVSEKNIGVRIPAHWISEFVAGYGRPVVTTSVNLSGRPSASSLLEFEKFSVDFVIFEGDKLGKPSTVVDLTSGEFVRR